MKKTKSVEEFHKIISDNEKELIEYMAKEIRNEIERYTEKKILEKKIEEKERINSRFEILDIREQNEG